MRKIVLVEDNPDNRLLVEVMIGSVFELIQYETGIEALKHLAHDQPELILLDISLPGMDGIQVLEKIRADEKLCQIPVIALTAHAMVGDREALMAQGFDEYITKPILDEDVFIQQIKNCLP